MFHLLTSLLCAVFKVLFTKRKDLIFTLIVLKKENQIYKRQLNQKEVHNSITRRDRFFLTVIYNLSRRAISHLIIVKPSTLLRWQRNFIKKFWTFQHKSSGRKPIANDIKKLILQMKQENLLWGCQRIADELKKVGIELNPTTVNRIIQNFRKQGKIQPTGSWKRFLKSHWDSLYGMDFMTIDTLLGKRFYLLIILELKSRKIVRADLTENPCREFVKQRVQLFSEDYQDKKTLIFDNAPQFTSIDYSWYDLKGVNICPYAPDMNAYTERVVGSIRREALDHFLLFSEKQVRRIIKEYVEYYNCHRPHQGIEGIPEGHFSQACGKIRKMPILGGLHHQYYRSSA